VRLIGIGIDIADVLIIVAGIVWASYRFLRPPAAMQRHELGKIRIGRSLPWP
jgi:hypothetical protein